MQELSKWDFPKAQCHGIVTWDLLITWLASSWMENFTPSSEEKDAMGDSVPDVSTMLRTVSHKSEKVWETKTQL